MRLARAVTRPHPLVGVLRLNAVAEPVGAGWRAWLVAQRPAQPLSVCLPGRGVGAVTVADVLRQVLSQVADAPGRAARSGEHALSVEPRTESSRVQRLVIGTDGIERVVPGRQ